MTVQIKDLVTNNGKLQYRELCAALIERFGVKQPVKWDSVLPHEQQQTLFGGEVLRLISDHPTLASQKEIRPICLMKGELWFPLTGAVSIKRDVAIAKAPKKTGPVDPLTGPKLALAGRVVTMDDTFSVKDEAIVYVEMGRIAAVQERRQAAPPGFEGIAIVETGGTLFPGLIELHNHLSYNVLPLWAPVPTRFVHRGQWPDHKDYRKLISGPMTVVGEYRDASGKPALLPALVRYVESKCLLGGVTTSQGVKLAGNAGVQRFYRGIVRNVEQTDEVWKR